MSNGYVKDQAGTELSISALGFVHLNEKVAWLVELGQNRLRHSEQMQT